MARVVLLMFFATLGGLGCNGSKEEVPGPYGGLDLERTGLEDLANKDKQLASYLVEHYDNHSLLADDNLRFSVQQGGVTVRGAVDSIEERSALRKWLEAVPGVTSVNDAELIIER